MITDAFLYVIYGIVYVISQPILLLDNVVIPEGVWTAFTNIIGYLKALDSFLPMSTILILLGISVSIEVSYLTYKLFMWVVKRFPTQS